MRFLYFKTLFSLILMAAAAWLAMAFLLPLFFPFLLGAALALASEPGVAFLGKKTRLPRGLCAGIGVSLTFAGIAVLALFLGAFLLRELGALSGVLPPLVSAIQSGISVVRSWLLGITRHLPPSLQPIAQRNVATAFSGSSALLQQAASYILSLAGAVLTRVPDSALTFGAAIISGYMISARMPKIRLWFRRNLPRERLKPLLDTLRRIRRGVWGWLLAQAKLVAISFALLLAGLTLLRIPYAFVWSVAIAFVDLLPVLGTGTVLLPWALILFLQSDVGRGVGILGLYAVIALTRSLLEPRLVGKELGLDPLVTLMALYAGYRLWGFPGLILAPVLAVAAQQLLSARQE